MNNANFTLEVIANLCIILSCIVVKDGATTVAKHYVIDII